MDAISMTVARARNAFATSESTLRAIEEGKDSNVINQDVSKSLSNPFDTVNVKVVTAGKSNDMRYDLDLKTPRFQVKEENIEGKVPGTLSSEELKNENGVYVVS